MTDIAELYRTHRGHMFRLACRYVGDQETAEDVVQGVFERLLTAEIRDPEAALKYLRVATVNGSVSAIRRRVVRRAGDDRMGRRELKRDEPSAEQVALQRLQRTAVLGAVPDALQALAPQQRAVYLLRYYADMNEEQISEVLGISRGAIKSHTSRGKAHLARSLDRVGQPYA